MPPQGAAACVAGLEVSAFLREVKSKSFCLFVITPQRGAEITLLPAPLPPPPVPFPVGQAGEELALSSAIC